MELYKYHNNSTDIHLHATLSLSLSIYIYIYLGVCVYICVCVFVKIQDINLYNDKGMTWVLQADGDFSGHYLMSPLFKMLINHTE